MSLFPPRLTKPQPQLSWARLSPLQSIQKAHCPPGQSAPLHQPLHDFHFSLSPPLGIFAIQWFFPFRFVSLSSPLCWPLYAPFPGQLPVKSLLKSSLWSQPYPANCLSPSPSSMEMIKTLNCTSFAFAFPVSPMPVSCFTLSTTLFFSSIKWRNNRVVARIKNSCAKWNFAWDICFQ